MLWRFNFFVQGKHLEKVLEALSGVAINMEPPQLVGNAVVEKVNGQKQVKAELPGTSITAQVTAWASAFAHDMVITSSQIQDTVINLGGSQGGNSYYTIRLLKAGIIKRRSRGVFVRTKKEG